MLLIALIKWKFVHCIHLYMYTKNRMNGRFMALDALVDESGRNRFSPIRKLAIVPYTLTLASFILKKCDLFSIVIVSVISNFKKKTSEQFYVAKHQKFGNLNEENYANVFFVFIPNCLLFRFVPFSGVWCDLGFPAAISAHNSWLATHTTCILAFCIALLALR